MREDALPSKLCVSDEVLFSKYFMSHTMNCKQLMLITWSPLTTALLVTR